MPYTLLVLAYLGFISLGLPDTVIGVAWPSIRRAFDLSQSGMGLVLAVGMAGYVASGLIAGRLVRRLGVGGLLAASCALVAIAETAYATAPVWAMFFSFAAVWGLGSGAIDSALNAYAARHFPVRHVNWLHACWSVGATIGPVLMTGALSWTGSYRPGYATLAVILGSMALAFALTRRSWDDDGADAAAPAAAPPPPVSVWQALRSGRVWLHIVVFFIYTGLETTAGQWCFTIMREGRGLGLETAGAWTSAYWGSILAGRVAVGFVVDRIGPDRLLRLCTVTAVLGALGFALDAGAVGRLGLLLLGVSLAPLYPTLMARTPARLGAALTVHAVGFQVSFATVGAASMPAVAGFIATGSGVGVVAYVSVALAVVLLVLHEVVLRVTRHRPED
jgi:fucose permease